MFTAPSQEIQALLWLDTSKDHPGTETYNFSWIVQRFQDICEVESCSMNEPFICEMGSHSRFETKPPASGISEKSCLGTSQTPALSNHRGLAEDSQQKCVKILEFWGTF